MSWLVSSSSVEVETARDITSPEGAIEVMDRMDELRLRNPMLVVGIGYTAVIASKSGDSITDPDKMRSLDQEFTRPVR